MRQSTGSCRIIGSTLIFGHQHRVVANFLAVEAWSRGLDCIALERADLEQLLGLKRFKAERVRWMMENFKPWVPDRVRYYGRQESTRTLYLSGVPIEEHLAPGWLTTEPRIARMPKTAPRTKRFRKVGTPNEGEIVSRLAILAAGLDVPRGRSRSR